jgi:hypothetical protein
MLVTTLNTSAQGRYDDDSKLFRFGFSLGMNAFDFGIENSLKPIDGKIYYADVSKLKPGFSVGIVTDMLVSRYLNLRFTPTLHFGERELDYGYDGISENDKFSQNVPSVPMSFPIYLKYSSERYGNLRPYLIGGGGVYFDLGQNKDNPLYLQTFDVFAEFGVGCDIYFSFFKLAPELKFALGFGDMLGPIIENPEYPNVNIEKKKVNLPISKLTSRLITLTFNFE